MSSAHPVRSEKITDVQRGHLRKLSEASLPTLYGPSTLAVFGYAGFSNCDELERVATLTFENPEFDSDASTLVRIHSACLTGDILGSLKCDCGCQLDAAMKQLARARRGVLIYVLNHEGRGIGLAQKVRAYALQDEGLDTVEANRVLGVPDDAREYRDVVACLKLMGLHQFQLLTNNPSKIRALDEGDFTIDRTSIVAGVNPANVDYLEAKRVKMGHILPQFLGNT